MPAESAVRKRTGGRWARIAPPLLCGLLADLCLVLLPFRPRLERLAGILIVVSVAGLAIGHELRQAKGEREEGRIELGSVRRGGIVGPAIRPGCAGA